MILKEKKQVIDLNFSEDDFPNPGILEKNTLRKIKRGKIMINSSFYFLMFSFSMANRTFSHWVWRLHNQVNDCLEKPKGKGQAKVQEHDQEVNDPNDPLVIRDVGADQTRHVESP